MSLHEMLIYPNLAQICASYTVALVALNIIMIPLLSIGH